MPFTYQLPPNGKDDTNTQVAMSTEVNSVIIVGANGSGKSKLGAWIERQNRIGVHRIGAQRYLSWQDTLTPKSLEVLENTFLYGYEGMGADITPNRFMNWKDCKTTTERRDIDAVLSAIFSKRTTQLEDFDERSKSAPSQQLPRESNIVDTIQQLWDTIFPHREIKFRDLKIISSINGKEYNGTEMSDGERVVLYLIAQVLLVPQDRTIIIDEPEIHVHRSIITRLWTALEKKRSDCLFIYITHDTEFAASHKQSDKIWVKNFDGTGWEWEKVNISELPESLLLELLGNRKKVLFVEGEQESFDTKLYQLIYPDYYIVPCGSCLTVIERTKAYKNTPQLVGHIAAYGLIDRDYRTDNEITKLAEKGIYSINLAEVENLFICKELLHIIAKHQEKTTTEVNNIINFIIDTKYCNQLNQQVAAATAVEIKFLLSIADVTSAETLKRAFDAISYDDIRNKIQTKFDKAKIDRNYIEVLKLFNEKALAKTIGHFLGITDNDYCDLVLRLANGDKNKEVRSALSLYLPAETLSPTQEQENATNT